MESRFSNRDELDQIAEYRRFNLASIFSVLLGLASASALIAPNLWIVPILAVLLGVGGLWMAKRSDNMGGATAAWVGIALALFFVSWAAADIYFQRQVVYAESKAVAEKWLNLVISGEDKIAHQAMMHPTARQPAGFSVDDYYSMDDQATTDKDRVFKASPAADIMALGADAKIRLIQNITQDVDLRYAKLIRQVYRVSAPGKEPVDALLSITRSHKEDLGRATWIVANIEPPEE